jgi:hypothetical protein
VKWIDAHLGRVDVQEETVFRADVLRNHKVPLRAVAALFLRLPLAIPAGRFLRRLNYQKQHQRLVHISIFFFFVRKILIIELNKVFIVIDKKILHIFT